MAQKVLKYSNGIWISLLASLMISLMIFSMLTFPRAYYKKKLKKGKRLVRSTVGEKETILRK
jgi:hypothetical protein